MIILKSSVSKSLLKNNNIDKSLCRALNIILTLNFIIGKFALIFNLITHH